MTISKRVQKELVKATPAAAVSVGAAERKRVNKAKTTREARAQREAIAARTKGQAWTPQEHDRFLEALQLFPSGPWEAVAEYVGTKNSRQTMTHAQKYRQKHERQQRGLRSTSTTAKTLKTTTKRAHATVATTPRQSVQPYMVKREKAMAISTLDELPEMVTLDVESPRSGEEESHEHLLPPIDMDLFRSAISTDIDIDTNGLAASAFTGAGTTLDNAQLLEQLFQDFDPMLTQMWSTNSLTDDAPMDALSALPEELSQSLGLWT